MVQGWYQGGVSVFDYTDINHPKEIAYFDRGPLDASRLMTGGSWSAYWYNGVIVSSEIARGLDIFELLPSGFISQNELAAAKLVHFDYLNAQGQPHLLWPASFSVVRSYVDQLARGNGMPADKIAAIRADLDRAEQQSGAARRTALTSLSSRVSGDAGSATDSPRARALVAEIDRLAAASQ